MSRAQIALDVTDIEASVDPCSTCSGVTPHKRRPGYASFVVENPPLKLGLIETDEVGPATFDEDDTTCCYTLQDKVRTGQSVCGAPTGR